MSVNITAKRILIILLLATVSHAYSSKIRVVSLSPSVTEIICALGKGECLVGRSSRCNTPEAVKKVPVAGEFAMPNIEKIISLKPDVIVSDAYAGNVNYAQLQSAGIKKITLKNQCIADYCRGVTTLGCLLDAGKAAERECRRFQNEIAELKSVEPHRKPKVLVLLGVNPLISCGKNSFVNEIVSLAGAENITGNFEKPYFVISQEFVAAENPDAVIVAGVPYNVYNVFKKIPAWQKLKFFRNKAVIDAISPDLLCRLSPHTPRGIKMLQTAIRRVCSNKSAGKTVKTQAGKADAELSTRNRSE